MFGPRPIRSRCSAPHLRRLGIVVAVLMGLAQPAARPMQAVGVVQPAPPPMPGSGRSSGVTGVDGATPTTPTVATEALALLDPARAPLEPVHATESDLDRQLVLVGAKVEASRSEALLRLLRRADGPVEQQAEQQAEQVVDPPVPDGLSMPIDAVITSEFGDRWGRHHDGIDFESDVGVPIHAAEGGLVLEAGWIDGYGLTVVIEHGGGLSTLYAHQSAISVELGERVERGQLVGEVGLTGNTTGPHLHFETRQGDVPVDPRKYLA